MNLIPVFPFLFNLVPVIQTRFMQSKSVIYYFLKCHSLESSTKKQPTDLPADGESMVGWSVRQMIVVTRVDTRYDTKGDTKK